MDTTHACAHARTKQRTPRTRPAQLQRTHARGGGVLTALTEYPRTLAPLGTHAHCADRRLPTCAGVASPGAEVGADVGSRALWLVRQHRPPRLQRAAERSMWLHLSKFTPVGDRTHTHQPASLRLGRQTARSKPVVYYAERTRENANEHNNRFARPARPGRRPETPARSRPRAPASHWHLWHCK
jgi:hypothetical protein